MIPAHIEACLLTFEQARSFFRNARSIWHASSHSLGHELSNDMLDYIPFFKISSNSAKISSAEIAPNLFARAQKVRRRTAIEILKGKVNTCTRCAEVRNVRFRCGFRIWNPHSPLFNLSMPFFVWTLQSGSIYDWVKRKYPGFIRYLTEYF